MSFTQTALVAVWRHEPWSSVLFHSGSRLRETVRDARRTYNLPAQSDVRAVLKRAALAAVPKNEAWTLRLFTLERTTTGERVAAVLDRLASRELGSRDFAAAVAATLDGSLAVLAVATKDPKRLDRMTSALRGAEH